MNCMEMAKNQAIDIIKDAYKKALDLNLFPQTNLPKIVVETPKDAINGDWASPVAMQFAKLLRMPPQKIAEILVENMDLSNTYFEKVEIAKAGFINFSYNEKWYKDAVLAILDEHENYGKTKIENPKKIMVEFVSANPTGPMHMGNARGGVLGDCLAKVLEWAGNNVTKEFYINDAGNQVDKFAHSVEGRYIQLIKGENAIEFDASWYQGEDIKDLAKMLFDNYGESLLELTQEERFDKIVGFGLPHNIEKMKRDLERYKIKYDVWFRESTLHNSGAVEKTVELLKNAGVTYEKDGALWLRSTDFGAEKDDVLRRANGFYTYFAADIAYHRNKFEERGFDKVINIWGADHHGHVARLQKALDAIGLDGSNRLEIVLMQLVRMVRDGEIVRMSKRTGKSLTLSDLLDEIPVDAARFFFNSRAAETQMEFDIGLAVKQDSENPLYYVQYAHARINSVLKATGELPKILETDLSVLCEQEEKILIKILSQFPNEIVLAANERDSSQMNKYAVSLAAQFHKFYNSCRINNAQKNVRDARILLCMATAQTIKNVLFIIGVDAPEHM